MRGRCAAPSRPQYAPLGGCRMMNEPIKSPSRSREGLGEGMSSASPSREQALPRPLPQAGGESRTDWTREEIAELFNLPFDELMWEAQGVHRRHHARGEVQLCTLLSIKTGGCVEDCGYCSQSKHADSGLKATKPIGRDSWRAGGEP